MRNKGWIAVFLKWRNPRRNDNPKKTYTLDFDAIHITALILTIGDSQNQIKCCYKCNDAEWLQYDHGNVVVDTFEVQ